MTDLSLFLQTQVAESEEIVLWSPSRLLLKSYLTATLPPENLIVSVRAIVRTAQNVLLLRNFDEQHILPGGRREVGETFEDTIKREVLEETGWSVRVKQLLGVRHFHHLTPRPPNYAYAYPDFFQLVYLVSPLTHQADYRRESEYEQEALFIARHELNAIPLSTDQYVWLKVSDNENMNSFEQRCK